MHLIKVHVNTRMCTCMLKDLLMLCVILADLHVLRTCTCTYLLSVTQGIFKWNDIRHQCSVLRSTPSIGVAGNVQCTVCFHSYEL